MRRATLLFTALSTLACAGLGAKDDPAETGIPREEGDADADSDADADADADGDADADTDTEPDLDSDGSNDFDDCNDTDPNVHPGATEYCNGVDDDCDGVTDPDTSVDATTEYPDDDRDGFGDETSPHTACEHPSSEVENGDDCDDTDRDVNPDANETCQNGLDDDCDGAVDDADSDAFCDYTRLTGTWDLENICVFDSVGTPADGRDCPTCDFSFDTTHTGRGVCGPFVVEAVVGYTAADAEVVWIVDGYDPAPFDAWMSSGSGYDILYFEGVGPVNALTYYGQFHLY